MRIEARRLSGVSNLDMKFKYHPESDALCIGLTERPDAERRELSDGVGVDYDSAEHLVVIDVEHAGCNVQLRHLVLRCLDGSNERIAGYRRRAVRRRSPSLRLDEHMALD